MKQQQQKKNEGREHPLDLSLYKKKIKKEEKLEKYLKKKRNLKIKKSNLGVPFLKKKNEIWLMKVFSKVLNLLQNL